MSVHRDLSSTPPSPHHAGCWRLLGPAEAGLGRDVYRAANAGSEREVVVHLTSLGEDELAASERLRERARALHQHPLSGHPAVLDWGVDLRGERATGWVACASPGWSRPIVDYARLRALDALERLELAARACELVQHTHDAGYVHGRLDAGQVHVDGRGRLQLHGLALGAVREVSAHEDVRALARLALELLGGWSALPGELRPALQPRLAAALHPSGHAHSQAARRLARELRTIASPPAPSRQ